MDIYYLCLLFYYLVPEQFIKCGKHIEPLTSYKTMLNDIARIKCNRYRGNTYIYGDVNIYPKDNPNAIMEWTIKVFSYITITKYIIITTITKKTYINMNHKGKY